MKDQKSQSTARKAPAFLLAIALAFSAAGCASMAKPESPPDDSSQNSGTWETDS